MKTCCGASATVVTCGKATCGHADAAQADGAIDV